MIKNDDLVKYIPARKIKTGSTPIKVISLFSSCGGMDLGFLGGFKLFGEHYSKNPYRIVYAGDIVKQATLTYNANFSHQAKHEDINKLDVATLPEADVVVGGFPCQAFSLAGKRQGFDDEKGRGQLYLQMKRVIDHVKPKIFVAENVDGLRSAKNGVDSFALDKIVEDFATSGYRVVYKVLKAVEYGVPQTRVRIIIMGLRNDLIGNIYYPEITHSNDTDLNLKPLRTTGDAIDDLWEQLDKPNAPPNHSTSDYSKCKFYPGKKTQGNQKENKNKPAHTVRSESHGNVYGHYYSTGEDKTNEDMTTWRRLTTRECARIQTFPDTFVFPVSRSASEVQIGNAVPPVLAWHIARAVMHTLGTVSPIGE